MTQVKARVHICKTVMGIPSFYRHLCRRFPHIVSSGPRKEADWLCLDFNCAMYYVLRQQPPLAEAVSHAAWENDFAKSIVDYMREIILLTRPTKGVYVSCDGVVCAAKRRQQRLRRFKSPWISAAEAAVRAQADGPSVSTSATSSKWDQNALTPGTEFMSMLGEALTQEGARIAEREGIQVVVSTTSEPGEGEHKLLRAMRSLTPAPRSCVIYGLDADLILLSMLLETDTGAVVHLMREAQEFETGSGGEAEWRCLSVRDLIRVILPAGATRAAHVRDFVCGMSLLGNDFLPRSLTKTVRDDGIPALIATLDREVWTRGNHLINRETGTIQRGALTAIINAWAATEDKDLLVAAQGAARAATRPPGKSSAADSPAETAVREWSAQPARWAALTRLLVTDNRPDERRRAIYAAWHPGTAENYCAGLAWVWDYYSGRAVDQAWVFEEHLPPLWRDIAEWLITEREREIVSAPPIVHPEPLPEWKHLLAVLPMDSIRRLLPLEKHTLAQTHPWYWPTRWSLFDVGRTQMWECEAVIPLIPERLLRTAAKK